MGVVVRRKGDFTVKAYPGDAKTLLAFNLPKPKVKGLAGFTICCQPGTKPAYYIFNTLQFEHPSRHAQVDSEPPNSSINAPIHKFRWLHVPGSSHQGTKPFLGKYAYLVTPRYFDASGSMLPLDQSLTVSVPIDVLPFRKGDLAVGFTRGFVQSQAFVNHFGKDTPIEPKTPSLLFSTSDVAGKNASGNAITFADEYEWLGFTARERIFEIIDDVMASKTLKLDVFAYDLNEPDFAAALLKLAALGRVRVILDNASLHHDAATPTREDEFETQFNARKKAGAEILRSHFSRYAHDKILIVRNKTSATKVLTGSTNFSITGMYVNSNHVLVFTDRKVAQLYADVFDEAWKDGAKSPAFSKSAFATQTFSGWSTRTPTMEISFSPHDQATAQKLMDDVAARISKEGKSGKTVGSVLFAVMDLGSGDGPVRPALLGLHEDQTIFSYGISDSTKGISLYAPGRKTGVLVTGRPASTVLPPPFDQVKRVDGHQVHHKFVVCGFNGASPVVYCGSSNLATGGEHQNGDNLLAIHDADVATAFAIEALSLVDHFDFLNRFATNTGVSTTKLTAPAAKQKAAAENGWFLSVTDKWTAPYYDPNDLHKIDRELFG